MSAIGEAIGLAFAAAALLPLAFHYLCKLERHVTANKSWMVFVPLYTVAHFLLKAAEESHIKVTRLAEAQQRADAYLEAKHLK